jgi:ABC-type uncharacterized transport system involved in gliding motility auxiliary subunit
MSQIDTGENVLSETIEEHSINNSLKRVPVTEAIRYRKRAQSAEKQAETLAEQLAQAKSEVSEMTEQLKSVEIEQELIRKLAAAGTVDLETAVLVAKARIEGRTEADLDGVIEQLREEKQYLFGGQKSIPMASKRTAPAKDMTMAGAESQTVLTKAAKKAATTGSRTDLQEYLKLRRNFV